MSRYLFYCNICKKAFPGGEDNPKEFRICPHCANVMKPTFLTEEQWAEQGERWITHHNENPTDDLAFMQREFDLKEQNTPHFSRKTTADKISTPPAPAPRPVKRNYQSPTEHNLTGNEHQTENRIAGRIKGYGRGFIIVGIVIFIIALIVCLVAGIFDDFSFIAIPALIGELLCNVFIGFLLLGFAEVIQLLQDIKDNQR